MYPHFTQLRTRRELEAEMEASRRSEPARLSAPGLGRVFGAWLNVRA